MGISEKKNNLNLGHKWLVAEAKFDSNISGSIAHAHFPLSCCLPILGNEIDSKMTCRNLSLFYIPL